MRSQNSFGMIQFVSSSSFAPANEISRTTQGAGESWPGATILAVMWAFSLGWCFLFSLAADAIVTDFLSRHLCRRATQVLRVLELFDTVEANTQRIR
jgi:hypothetical protein